MLLPCAAVLCVLAGPAGAQWIPSGVLLCQGGCAGDAPLIVADGTGGAFVVWRDVQNYPVSGEDLYLQRVTSSGTIAPGWPPEALPLCVARDFQFPFDIAPDGQGGVLVVWLDWRNSGSGGTGQDVYAQRVLADGTLAPGWSVNGVPVVRAPGYQDFPFIVSDGAGGAFVAWEDERDYATHARDIYALHLGADGAPAPGWPVNGIAVCSDPADAGAGGIVADGAGGAVVVWGDLRRGVVDIYAQHLLADGSLAPGWVANGVPVLLNRMLRQAVTDAAGGFYVSGRTINASYFDAAYDVQRFTSAGAPAAGWPAVGVPVCRAPGSRDGLRTVADGVGGALLTWYDYRPPATGGEIYAARVLADGTLATGWTVDGTRVSDASVPGYEYDPDIAPDGSGGAYVVWVRENGYSAPAQVQHLTRNAAVAAGWPAYGVRVAPSDDQLDVRIAHDGRRGAIVTWAEACCGRMGMYAQRFVLDGPVAILLSLVSAAAEPDRVTLVWHAAEGASLAATVERRGVFSDWMPLGTVTADGTGRIEYLDRSIVAGERYGYRLAYTEDGIERRTTEAWVDVPRVLTLALEGLRPNPAVGPLTVSFTLPSWALATLELLDVSGRRVIGRDVGSLGAGHHLLRLEEGARLAPGMYWLRLTQNGRALVTRGVVVR